MRGLRRCLGRERSRSYGFGAYQVTGFLSLAIEPCAFLEHQRCCSTACSGLRLRGNSEQHSARQEPRDRSTAFHEGTTTAHHVASFSFFVSAPFSFISAAPSNSSPS